ncbi:unnamed protein product [[Candida] boidinii]|nr:unnamed protein product [[Candida] boidinii]
MADDSVHPVPWVLLDDTHGLLNTVISFVLESYSTSVNLEIGLPDIDVASKFSSHGKCPPFNNTAWQPIISCKSFETSIKSSMVFGFILSANSFPLLSSIIDNASM